MLPWLTIEFNINFNTINLLKKIIDPVLQSMTIDENPYGFVNLPASVSNKISNILKIEDFFN